MHLVLLKCVFPPLIYDTMENGVKHRDNNVVGAQNLQHIIMISNCETKCVKTCVCHLSLPIQHAWHESTRCPEQSAAQLSEFLNCALPYFCT